MKDELTLEQRLVLAPTIGVAIGIQIPTWLGLFQSVPGFIFGIIITLSTAYLFYYIEETIGMIGWTYSYICRIRTGRFWANVFYQWLPATIAYVELLYIVLFVAIWKEYGIHFIIYSGKLHLGSGDIVFVTTCALVAVIATVADIILHNPTSLKVNREFQGTTFLTVWRKFWSDLKIIFQFKPLRQDLFRFVRAVKTTAIWCFRTLTTVVLALVGIVIFLATQISSFLKKTPLIIALIAALWGYWIGWNAPSFCELIGTLSAAILVTTIYGTVSLIVKTEKAYSPLDHIMSAVEWLWPN